MKKLILFCGLLFTSAVFSQFTQTNEPGLNQSLTLYVLDNTAPNYEATTGTGLTWDYSGVTGVDGQTQTAATLSMDNTDYETTYPAADYALTVGGRVTNFYESSVNNRISHGLVFVEPTLGAVIARFSDDQALEYEYPMNFGDVINDDFEGRVTYGGEDYDCEGSLTATVDGRGTLKLANENDFIDVLRYKITRNLVIKDVELNIGVIILVDVNLEVTQYEYYDFEESNFPIFAHTYTKLSQLGSGTVFFEENNVLSLINPADLSTSSNEMINTKKLDVYPNPANDKVFVDLSLISGGEEVIIYDAMGKQVHRQNLTKNHVSIDVSNYRKGVYLVRVLSNDLVETRRIVVK